MINEKGYWTPKGYLTTAYVPKQLEQVTAQFVTVVVEGAAFVLGLLGFGLLLITSLAGGSAQQDSSAGGGSKMSTQMMFGLVRSLQLTVHLRLFKLTMTALVEQLYEEMSNAVMFDFLEMVENETGNEYRLLEFSDSDPFS